MDFKQHMPLLCTEKYVMLIYHVLSSDKLVRLKCLCHIQVMVSLYCTQHKQLYLVLDYLWCATSQYVLSNNYFIFLTKTNEWSFLHHPLALHYNRNMHKGYDRYKQFVRTAPTQYRPAHVISDQMCQCKLLTMIVFAVKPIDQSRQDEKIWESQAQGSLLSIILAAM